MNLNRLAYFAAVVDAGSFTRAAERLGISKAVVSQQVARLEAEVGTTLLVRTTRKVYPTEAGRMFHVRCAFILREAEDAFGELGQALSTPTGTLRMTAPFDYGISRVVPAVIEFTRRYPACNVDLSLGVDGCQKARKHGGEGSTAKLLSTFPVSLTVPVFG